MTCRYPSLQSAIETEFFLSLQFLWQRKFACVNAASAIERLATLLMNVKLPQAIGIFF